MFELNQSLTETWQTVDEADEDDKEVDDEQDLLQDLEYSESDDAEARATKSALKDLMKPSYTNEKTEASPIRDKLNANALYNAFVPVQIFAMVFGRFPLRAVLQPDGTRHYEPMNTSFNTLYFVVTTILITLVLLVGSIGFVLLLSLEDGLPKDFCGKSWTHVKLAQLVVPVSITWSWILLTFFGSIFMFLRGGDYAHYINYWIRSTQVLDMDVSYKAKWVGLREWLTVIGILAVYIGLYASYLVDPLVDAGALIAHALVRMFKHDLYRDTLDLLPDRVTKAYCYEWKSYHSWSLLGFLVQLYALCATRCFMVQFQFFCRTLNQASETWCCRFQNTMNHIEPNPKDERKRRLTFKELLKDHLILVQLYKLTDVTFGTMLVAFYCITIIDFCFEGFQLYNGITYNTCYQVGWLYDQIMENCPEGKAPNNNSFYTQLKMKSAPNFEGCYPGYEQSGAIDTGVAILFFAQTLASFLSTTLDAANAFEKSMQGFNILRRYGFMYCTNRKERNFIHSLAISYCYFKPMQVSARGYFLIGRPIVVHILLVVITWFVVMLQLRDLSEIDINADSLCTNITNLN